MHWIILAVIAIALVFLYFYTNQRMQAKTRVASSEKMMDQVRALVIEEVNDAVNLKLANLQSKVTDLLAEREEDDETLSIASDLSEPCHLNACAIPPAGDGRLQLAQGEALQMFCPAGSPSCPTSIPPVKKAPQIRPPNIPAHYSVMMARGVVPTSAPPAPVQTPQPTAAPAPHVLTPPSVTKSPSSQPPRVEVILPKPHKAQKAL